MDTYVCTRCGQEDVKGWTDYWMHVGMGLAPLCAECDPKQRCHFHHEAKQQKQEE